MYNMFIEFFNVFIFLVFKGQGLVVVIDVEVQERIIVGINWVDIYSGGCYGCSFYYLELFRLQKIEMLQEIIGFLYIYYKYIVSN